MNQSRIASLLLLSSVVTATLTAQADSGVEPISVNILELMRVPDSSKLDANVLERLRSEVTKAREAGRLPIGFAAVWVFPSASDAPRVPRPTLRLPDAEPVRINCIPELGSPEYQRWAAVRDDLWAELARQLPELDRWVVGVEPNQSVFCDCSGTPLRLDQYVRFAADTLKGVTKEIKAVNSGAWVYAHFLGMDDQPLKFGKVSIQPRQVQNMLLQEINGRGVPTKEFFDATADSLYPALLADRESEEANFQEGSWNVYWTEEFYFNSPDLSSVPGWVKILTDDMCPANPYGSIYMPPTEVLNGKAQVKVDDYQNPCVTYYREPGTEHYYQTPDICTSVGGARTDFDAVPDELFPLCADWECRSRNWWRVCLDYVVQENLSPVGNHNPVFLRVNDRICPGSLCWNLDDPFKKYRKIGSTYDPISFSNQTRFGAFVWRDPSRQGCLQLEGDSVSRPGYQAQALINFPVDYEPTKESGHLFQNQINEKAIPYMGRCCHPRWEAQIWDLTAGVQIGESSSVTLWELINVWGIYMPEFTGSRVMMGLGPGTAGQYGAERIRVEYYAF